MILAFIKIRLFQIYRTAKGLGFFRTLFILGLIVLLGLGVFTQTTKTPDSYYISGIYLLMIFWVHLKRKDIHFLKSHFINYKLGLLMEYSLLIIPLYFSLIYFNQWMSLILVIILALLVVNLNFKLKQKSLNTFIQRLIPADCFEWKAGVRRSLFFIITIWVLGIISSFFIGSVPVVLYILGIFSISYYEKNEPIQMVFAYEMDANSFLMHKIRLQLVFFSIIALPLIISFLLFHYNYWYIPLIEYFVFITIQIYIILTKYAFYQPNVESNNVQLFEIIGAMGLFIPFLIPIIWLLAIRFYIKSKKNLNFYLNDYH
jgi:hypothetical protein